MSDYRHGISSVKILFTDVFWGAVTFVFPGPPALVLKFALIRDFGKSAPANSAPTSLARTHPRGL